MLGKVLALLFLFPATLAAEGSAPSRVEKPEFAVELQATKEYRQGQPSTFTVKLQARGHFHVNADYPSNFQVSSGPEAVRYARPRIDGSSGLTYQRCTGFAASCGAQVEVAFQSDHIGKRTLGGVMAFSVCDDERCLIEKVALALPITVR